MDEHKVKEGEMVKRTLLAMAFAGMVLVILSNLVYGEGKEEVGFPKIRGAVGYNWFAMKDFNKKLSEEGNNTIEGGENASIEISIRKRESPPFAQFFSFDLNYSPVMGIEMVDAYSRTTQMIDCKNIDFYWNIPVVGTYFTPITLNRSMDLSRVYVNPSLGLYTLDKVPFISNSRFTVTDHPGTLEVSGTRMGFLLQSGLGLRGKRYQNIEVDVVTGYRWLKFSRVGKNPKDGFSNDSEVLELHSSRGPLTLDYSGWIFRLGFGVYR